jgi:hypothetical protein
MNKLLIATLVAASMLTACGKTEAPTPAAQKPAAAAAKQAASAPGDVKSEIKPQVLAPKPPPPPGGRPEAPPLKPEDIARIQKMLQERAAAAQHASTPAAAAPAPAAPAPAAKK